MVVCGVGVGQILVIIFINKVVVEMCEWVVGLVGEKVWYMWVLMFYFICVCILCNQVVLIEGFNFNFLIYDVDDLWWLLQMVGCDLGLDIKWYLL